MKRARHRDLRTGTMLPRRADSFRRFAAWHGAVIHLGYSCPTPRKVPNADFRLEQAEAPPLAERFRSIFEAVRRRNVKSDGRGRVNSTNRSSKRTAEVVIYVPRNFSRGWARI